MEVPQEKRAAILAELNRALASCEMTPLELSKAAGIRYDAAWRALRGGVRNYTQTAKALCRCFGLQIVKSRKTQASRERVLEDMVWTIAEVWDGTQAHADLITRLVRSTGAFEVGKRK